MSERDQLIMDPEHIRALQDYNSGASQQNPTTSAAPSTQQPTTSPVSQGPNTQQPTINPTPRGYHPNPTTNPAPSDPPADYHKPKHTVPCTWEGCGRMFTCQHNVNQHIREAHTGERPSVCEICAKLGGSAAFSRPYSLNRHLRSQHGVEPYIHKKPPMKTIKTTGPVSAVPASAGRSKKGGRKPKAGNQQSGAVHGPSSMALPMQSPPAHNQSCQYCGSLLEGAEHAMLHMHLEHGVPASPHCGCSFCKNQRPQQPATFSFQAPAPQQPAQFPVPIQQPQPRRPFSPSQLDQRLLAYQQEQLNTESMADSPASADFTPPFDPAPTPGPDGSVQQFVNHEPIQESFDFIDYSQFPDGFGELPDNLDDLFPELGDLSKFGGDFNF
ncbi:hypothetical protein PRZ48_003068 [Zasmidium cellare]|uniref:C2H2-type domain-containing protein n=1 Tax=Zasmidium cellare TaxID=395010 RepID=A0ABR0EV11_ZASCE|nr:hypothetical protein PRZ48_003068 [Zasmidium cellare]